MYRNWGVPVQLRRVVEVVRELRESVVEFRRPAAHDVLLPSDTSHNR